MHLQQIYMLSVVILQEADTAEIIRGKTDDRFLRE
jgi:hypothetical protein